MRNKHLDSRRNKLPQINIIRSPIMLLTGSFICGYVLGLAAALAQQHITVDVLEGDSAILSHVYKSPLTSGSVQSGWNDYQGDSVIKYLGSTTCLIETLQCTFAGTDSFECYCNNTQISLRVKNNVSNEDHGHKYGSIDVQSQNYLYTLYVTVPVERVSITNVSKPTVVIAENTEMKLECRSSPSRPNATITWEHNSMPLDAWSLEGTMIGNLVEVNSILSLTPDRNMNGNNITCSGNNYRDDIKYDWVTLNVTYPPTGPPVIEHLQKNETFPIIENKDSFMYCINNVSNPPAQLDWNCDGADFISVTDVNITAKRLQIRASRKNNTVCSCISTYSTNVINKTKVKIDVLYPSTITSISANGTNISQIAVFENDTIHASCAAEGNPTPDYVWNENGNVLNGQNIIVHVKRFNTKFNFTCIASNVMNDTRENEVQGKDSKGFTVDVLYPPSIKGLLNISLIEGNSTSVDCNIIPGNPSTPTYIRWDDKPENRSLVINGVHRMDNRWHSCKVNNTMSTTFGETRYGIDEQSIFLHVLYSPEEFIVTSNRAPNHGLSDTIRLIENTSIKLFCSAKGNPMPSSYSWSGLNTSATSEVYVHGSKDKKGNVTCSAKNIMIELPENKTYIGIESKTILVDVLYPPEINLTDRKIIEGDDANITCVNIPGKVSYQSIDWTSNHINLTNNDSLIIRNVTRKHAGNCTCMVNYTMAPTYGESITNIITGVVYLDVLYQAELSEFYVGENSQNVIVSVNESDSVGMVCILDSNPGSTMNISVRNQTVSSKKHTKTLTYLIGQSSCSDTGVYTCSGYNFLNTNHPSRHLQLFVNCSPRKSSLVEIQQNLTLHNGTATFSFIALAYPPPTFKWWFRPDNSDFKEAGNGHYTTVNISENEMQINFTVVTSDYGEYVLTINNTFGSYQQSFFLLQADATYDEQKTPPGSGNAGQVAGGVIGGLLGIGAIVAALFLVRRRGLLSKGRNDDGGHHEYQNVGFTGELKQSKRLPALPPDDESEDIHGDHRTIAQQQDYDAEEHPYLNTMELIDLMKKVSVADLFSYVTNKSYQEFSDEFGKFPSGLMVEIPCSIASKPKNAALNRYQGIYPYDHSRVIILGQPDFFINASYIDGNSGSKEYIASLGPTVKHTLGFQTFWNMVWHEQSDVIVMLTNLQEPSGMKCEKYWAESGTTRNIGDFTIQSIGEEVTAEYKVRTFKVFKDDESRMVTQLHYTAWPDKKVPEDVTSLIEFRQTVKAAPTRSSGPLIVHCSAGVGRTGTYIALDRLIKEGKSKNAINVFDCVMNMRKQRVNMVQTLDQYVYLHQALVYCLVFDIEPVSSGGIEEYVKKTSNNVYSKLFQQLQQTVEDETIEEKEARARNGDMLEKNQKTADIPSDAHRIRLFLDKQFGESDYINAVYLNGFKRLGHFIIAQSPLPTTLDDFVCLLYQANCSCIVSLDDYLQTGASNVTYLPPDNQPMKYGTFTISCTNLDVKSGYSVRKLKLGHTGQFEKGERIVYHFEFTGWKHDERTPKDPKLFVDFVKEVDKHATQLEEENSHVLVHCMTGSERSGLFCAVYNLMDKMEQERQVSVVNMLRRIRARRKTAITNMEQLKFCYQALNAFVKSYKI